LSPRHNITLYIHDVNGQDIVLTGGRVDRDVNNDLHFLAATGGEREHVRHHDGCFPIADAFRLDSRSTATASLLLIVILYLTVDPGTPLLLVFGTSIETLAPAGAAATVDEIMPAIIMVIKTKIDICLNIFFIALHPVLQ